MKTIRDTILILAGASLLFTFITGINISDLQITSSQTNGAPLTETSEEQASVVTETVESTIADTPTPTPTPAVTILPSDIVIYGERNNPCTEYVTYEPFTIVVAEHLGKDIEPFLIHSPLHLAPDQSPIENPFCLRDTNTPRIETFLQVDQVDENCPREPVNTSNGIKCYQVSVRDDAVLLPGEYNSTLLISPEEDFPPSSANVSVKVRLNIWWPILAVTLGVLVTEFLVSWRKQLKYSTGWSLRRIQWFDLLSEKLDWVTHPMEGNSQQEALQLSKIKLRDERKKLTEWIDNGRNGKVKIRQVPEHFDAAEDKVFPLRNVVENYVSCCPVTYFQLKNAMNELVEAFYELEKLDNSKVKGNINLSIIMGKAKYLKIVFRDNEACFTRLAQIENKLSAVKKSIEEIISAENTKVRQKIIDAKTKVDSLALSVHNNTYHLTQFERKLNALEKAFKELGQQAITHAKGQLNQLDKELYTDLEAITQEQVYRDLNNIWNRNSPPSDEKLKEAWNIIVASVTQKEDTLEKDFTAIQTRIKTLPDKPTTVALASCVDTLNNHLKNYKKEIVDTAIAQQAAIKDVAANEDGKAETEAVLKKLAALETPLDKVIEMVQSAEQPLKFPNSDVDKEIKNLEKCIADIDEEIENLTVENLSEHAILGIMLEPIYNHLAKADEDMSKPQTEVEMANIWQRLKFDHNHDKRLVKIGKRLVRNYNNWGKLDESVKKHTIRGYQYLLNSEPLRAEIELERIEHRIVSKLWTHRINNWIVSVREGITRTLNSRDLKQYFDPQKHSANERVGGKIVKYVPLIIFIVLIIFLLQSMEGQLFSLQTNDLQTNEVLDWAFILSILIAVLLTVLLIAYLVYLVSRWRMFVVLRELLENFFVFLWNVVMVMLSQLLTVVVAVALILVANELVGSANTWGSPFDFVTAFTWGVLANRVSEPVTSALEAVSKVQEKPAEETKDESSESEESSEDT